MADNKIVSETAIFFDKDGNQVKDAKGADRIEVIRKFADGREEHTIMIAAPN